MSLALLTPSVLHGSLCRCGKSTSRAACQPQQEQRGLKSAQNRDSRRPTRWATTLGHQELTELIRIATADPGTNRHKFVLFGATNLRGFIPGSPRAFAGQQSKQ